MVHEVLFGVTRLDALIAFATDIWQWVTHRVNVWHIVGFMIPKLGKPEAQRPEDQEATTLRDMNIFFFLQMKRLRFRRGK